MPKAKTKKKKKTAAKKTTKKSAGARKTTKKPAAAKKTTKKSTAAKKRRRRALALVQPCLDAIDAAFIVGGCLPSGTHENDDTLEQIGMISPDQRRVFRECVFNGVLNKGCDINRGDIPNDGNTTVGAVRRAVVNNARPS